MTKKIVVFIIIFALAFLPGCSWRSVDIAGAAVLVAASAIDREQTLTIAARPEFYELNPILGRCPSRGSVNAYFLLSPAFKIAVAALLPAEYRTAWLWGWAGVSVGAVTFNHMQGIR